MKKTVIAISLPLVFASCSNKTEDFIGVNKFYSLDRYLVKDSTEHKNTFNRREPLDIWIARIMPITIDIFKSGEEIKGILTKANYQKTHGFSVIDKYNEDKIELNNIHLVNDTLIAEYGKSKELKMTKSGSEYYLIIKTDSTHIKQQGCNKFASTTNDAIIYKSIKGDAIEAEMIIESNECSAEKTAKSLVEKENLKESVTYLKKILSVEPEKNRFY